MTGFRPESAEDEHACRALLAVTPVAPTPLVTITTLSTGLAPDVELTVSYAADRLVLTRPGFEAYAKARAAMLRDEAPLERLAARVADDLANELVPKWLRVSLSQSAAGASRHSVTVEDRQPGWDHPALPKSF